jgi:WD40 repeat protein
MWDSGNNCGDFTGHSKVILSGDFKKTRPYRIVSGGEDFFVNFYEATPSFRFSKMNKEHTAYVTCVKYSPDDSKLVSVGFDKKIIIYDGKDAHVISTIAEDKFNENHTGAIIGVCWLDNKTIATCSLDKLVKVWDIEEKVCKYTLMSKKELDLPDVCSGIAVAGDWLISLSLSGVLNYWSINGLEDGKLPDLTYDGHQGNISGIISTKTGEILSSDATGKLCNFFYSYFLVLWDEGRRGRLLVKTATKIVSILLDNSEENVFILDGTSTVSSYNIQNNSVKYI